MHLKIFLAIFFGLATIGQAAASKYAVLPDPKLNEYSAEHCLDRSGISGARPTWHRSPHHCKCTRIRPGMASAYIVPRVGQTVSLYEGDYCKDETLIGEMEGKENCVKVKYALGSGKAAGSLIMRPFWGCWWNRDGE
ncbi:hypothetical protein B0J14DRAFT_598154 [Halenospora varia]|nr:hypothetical protein B0J14DRAFT_598154 [Halenospora varia]